MSLRKYFAEYKEIVKNHNNIKQNHKKISKVFTAQIYDLCS